MTLIRACSLARYPTESNGPHPPLLSNNSLVSYVVAVNPSPASANDWYVRVTLGTGTSSQLSTDAKLATTSLLAGQVAEADSLSLRRVRMGYERGKDGDYLGFLQNRLSAVGYARRVGWRCQTGPIVEQSRVSCHLS